MISYDLYNNFISKLKDFPITIVLTVSPNIMSKPFYPISSSRDCKMPVRSQGPRALKLNTFL